MDTPAALRPPDSRESTSPHYEFVKLLGRGGMAEVLLAHKTAPGGGFKEVAFKRILPQYTEDPHRVTKFMDEIAVAAALVHPNIVGVHHWGTYEGDYFIEMELVRGLSLIDYVCAQGNGSEGSKKYGRLLPVDVAMIGADMAEGLNYAHTFERGDAMGVVHRDISPDNVMITLHGRAKINDWGISKALKGPDRVASRTSHAYGKPYYAPPEQWNGSELDARADLYGLGTTLVLALCGRQLFPSGPNDTYESLLIRVFRGERPPIARIAPPDAPPALVDLLEQLVQADRERRPRSAKELIRPFKDLVRELSGGDLDRARESLAARVRRLYGAGPNTDRALTPAVVEELASSEATVSSTAAKTTRTVPFGAEWSSGEASFEPHAPPRHHEGAPRTMALPPAGLPAAFPEVGSRSSSDQEEPARRTEEAWRRSLRYVLLGGALVGGVALAAGLTFAVAERFVRALTAESSATQRSDFVPSPIPPDSRATKDDEREPRATEAPLTETGAAETGAAEAEAAERTDRVDSTARSEDGEPGPNDDQSSAAVQGSEIGEAPTGAIRVIAVPFGDVRLDGRPIALRRSHRVPAGTHRVVATYGGQRLVRTVRVEPGERERVVFRFSLGDDR